ncbi:hypothetical protein FGO68_gene120 [Halteria grandinella]|uniref:Uncharacterized protein n=1 Tax=Halteria grandinella TaxID=5974 RepID=A0A8J8T3M9_HALGN|nr:hypothetical protein FGO68_gene120 [Halteria grandinella]
MVPHHVVKRVAVVPVVEAILMGELAQQLAACLPLVGSFIQCKIYGFSYKQVVEDIPAFFLDYFGEEPVQLAFVEVTVELLQLQFDLGTVFRFILQFCQFGLEVDFEQIHSCKPVPHLGGHLRDEAGGGDHSPQMEVGDYLGKDLRGVGHVEQDVLQFPEETHQGSANLLLGDQLLLLEEELREVGGFAGLHLLDGDLVETHEEDGPVLGLIDLVEVFPNRRDAPINLHLAPLEYLFPYFPRHNQVLLHVVGVQGEPELAPLEQLLQLLRVHGLRGTGHPVQLLRGEKKLLLNLSLELLLVLFIRTKDIILRG